VPAPARLLDLGDLGPDGFGCGVCRGRDLLEQLADVLDAPRVDLGLPAVGRPLAAGDPLGPRLGGARSALAFARTSFSTCALSSLAYASTSTSRKRSASAVDCRACSSISMTFTRAAATCSSRSASWASIVLRGVITPP
jgi:hypothetical protein